MQYEKVLEKISMSNQVYRIQDYKFTANDAVLFDTNIWLYIYGPTGDRFPKLRSIYTLALRRIRSAKSQIFLDVLILSEFINAFSRFVYNELPQEIKPEDFKIFRDSDDFPVFAEKITIKVEKIIEKSELTESGFLSANLRKILKEYKTGTTDFNDQIIAELCKNKNLKLITHDRDFKDKDITIITANSLLYS